MKNSKNNSQGFTLLELMITVVIIGIVAGMAVPRFGPVLDRLKMKTAVREITSDFRLARSLAISDKEQYGLFFNATTRAITLFRDDVNPTTFTFESGDSIIKVDTLPAEFTWMATDCANDVLTFRSNGSAGFNGGGNVWAMAMSENTICISTSNILASTGRVQTNSYYY